MEIVRFEPDIGIGVMESTPTPTSVDRIERNIHALALLAVEVREKRGLHPLLRHQFHEHDAGLHMAHI